MIVHRPGAGAPELVDRLREHARLSGDLLRTSVDGGTVRTQWRMDGTRTDGTELDHRDVIVMGIPEDRIEWGRIYLEPVRTDEDVTWEVHRTATDDA